jgi:hypothetical protein
VAVSRLQDAGLDKTQAIGGRSLAGEPARQQLLAQVPVAERRLILAGVSTAVLEGGEGPPVVLLHGPMASAVHWT